MSVHAPLANRRQTLATASLRQFSTVSTLASLVEAERISQGLITTTTTKTLAQIGFVWLANPADLVFPAQTSWKHPDGGSSQAWQQVFGADASAFVQRQIDLGLAISLAGTVPLPTMDLVPEQPVGGVPFAPTVVVTTTPDLEPTAPTLQVVTAPRTTTTTGAGIAAGGGFLVVLGIGALFLFGRRR